mgnify:CR=1 FL=1
MQFKVCLRPASSTQGPVWQRPVGFMSSVRYAVWASAAVLRMRHTSARRYSFDDPAATVIVSPSSAGSLHVAIAYNTDCKNCCVSIAVPWKCSGVTARAARARLPGCFITYPSRSPKLPASHCRATAASRRGRGTSVAMPLRVAAMPLK